MSIVTKVLSNSMLLVTPWGDNIKESQSILDLCGISKRLESITIVNKAIDISEECQRIVDKAIEKYEITQDKKQLLGGKKDKVGSIIVHDTEKNSTIYIGNVEIDNRFMTIVTGVKGVQANNVNILLNLDLVDYIRSDITTYIQDSEIENLNINCNINYDEKYQNTFSLVLEYSTISKINVADCFTINNFKCSTTDIGTINAKWKFKSSELWDSSRLTGSLINTFRELNFKEPTEIDLTYHMYEYVLHYVDNGPLTVDEAINKIKETIHNLKSRNIIGDNVNITFDEKSLKEGIEQQERLSCVLSYWITSEDTKK